MTDARLKGEWLTAVAHDGLSDAAYRILHNALMHCAEQGTDGAISDRELRFLYPSMVSQEWLDELERAGFWERTDAGYQLLGWATTLGQSTAADVEAYRRRGRERQQRWREKKAEQAQDTSPGGEQGSDEPTTSPDDEHAPTGARTTRDVTRDVTRYVTGNVGQARLGSARPSPSLSKKKRARPPLRVIDGREICANDDHDRLPDGTCKYCSIRPDDIVPLEGLRR